jgi:hypothetical protein
MRKLGLRYGNSKPRKRTLGAYYRDDVIRNYIIALIELSRGKRMERKSLKSTSRDESHMFIRRMDLHFPIIPRKLRTRRTKGVQKGADSLFCILSQRKGQSVREMSKVCQSMIWFGKVTRRTPRIVVTSKKVCSRARHHCGWRQAVPGTTSTTTWTASASRIG